eukprot:30977-Pelagococcus_subviridis.AAC.9
MYDGASSIPIDTLSHCSAVNAAFVSAHVSWCVFLNSENVRRTVSLTCRDGSDDQDASVSSVPGSHDGTSYGAESTHAESASTAPCLRVETSIDVPSSSVAAGVSRRRRPPPPPPASAPAFKHRARSALSAPFTTHTPRMNPMSDSPASSRTSICASVSARNTASRRPSRSASEGRSIRANVGVELKGVSWG